MAVSIRTTHTLTATEVHALADILNGIGRHVRWLSEDGETVLSGTARHLMSGDGYPGPEADIRDRWMRITHDSGMEMWESMTRLVELRNQGGYAIDGDPR